MPAPINVINRQGETFARQRYSAPIFNLKRFLMLKTPKPRYREENSS